MTGMHASKTAGKLKAAAKHPPTAKDSILFAMHFFLSRLNILMGRRQAGAEPIAVRITAGPSGTMRPASKVWTDEFN